MTNYGHSVAIADLQGIMKSYERDVENAAYQVELARRVVREREADLNTYVVLVGNLQRSIELLETDQSINKPLRPKRSSEAGSWMD